MSTVGSSSREARRRRIAERGADRLALITGRVKSLTPEPDLSAPSAADSSQRDTATDSQLPPSDSVKEVSQQDKDRLSELIDKLLPGGDSSRNMVSRAASFLDTEEEHSPVISSTQSPLLEHQNERQRSHDTITAGQISSAFTASEQIRMFSSVAAALLVILSYIGFPILGWGSIRSIILFRPVYLLLVTNITIALARLILEGKLMFALPKFSGDTMDQVGKALEAGLLFKNVSGALFVDFGIYAVVLICGLPLVRRLGW